MSVAADSKTVVVKRVFDNTPEEVFSAFESAEILEQWLSPSEEINLHVALFEFRPGGSYEYHYTLPDGAEAKLTGTFLDIESPTLLSFTWQWAEPDHHAGIESHVSVTFAPAGHGTELTVTHSKLDHPNMTSRHQQGWIGSLDRLSGWLVRSSTK